MYTLGGLYCYSYGFTHEQIVITCWHSHAEMQCVHNATTLDTCMCLIWSSSLLCLGKHRFWTYIAVQLQNDLGILWYLLYGGDGLHGGRIPCLGGMESAILYIGNDLFTCVPPLCRVNNITMMLLSIALSSCKGLTGIVGWSLVMCAHARAA